MNVEATPAPAIGLRERKRARLKLALLDAAMREIGRGHSSSLAELPVEAICERAEVSRMTFFNYFPRKDDLLNYFMRLWCFHRAVEQHHQPLAGLRALDRLFRRAAEAREASAVFLDLIGWIAALTVPPPPVEIETAERAVLYPDDPAVFDLEVPHLKDLLTNHVSEARRSGEIGARCSEREVVQLLLTIFYGTPLARHTGGELRPRDLHRHYRLHLKLITEALT